MSTPHDQTYIEGLVTDLVVRTDANALVLAESGDNQLGYPYPGHPGYRNWDGNLISVGHHDKNTFALEVDAILPAHMSVEIVDHWHARLDDQGTWVRCPANADGAIPITVALARIHHRDEPR
ncbi:hypothetical protein ACFVYE_32240 [Streptomyces sp. NPDC058239]|uniref:hypothetical protein n=1 Tax=Streptomyces sp. NPDC058239 TaxID=3346395 RepID=UPI0036E58331